MLYLISWKKLKKVEKVKKKFFFGRFWPFFGSKTGYQMRFWAWTKWLFYRRIIWGVVCYCTMTFSWVTGLRKESFRHQNQAFFGVKFGHFWKPFFSSRFAILSILAVLSCVFVHIWHHQKPEKMSFKSGQISSPKNAWFWCRKLSFREAGRHLNVNVE